jgi:hypothetical protein
MDIWIRCAVAVWSLKELCGAIALYWSGDGFGGEYVTEVVRTELETQMPMQPTVLFAGRLHFGILVRRVSRIPRS